MKTENMARVAAVFIIMIHYQNLCSGCLDNGYIYSSYGRRVIFSDTGMTRIDYKCVSNKKPCWRRVPTLHAAVSPTAERGVSGADSKLGLTMA